MAGRVLFGGGVLPVDFIPSLQRVAGRDQKGKSLACIMLFFDANFQEAPHEMRTLRKLSSFALVMWLGILGCHRSPISGAPVLTHKLVVTGNEHSVPVYDNENSYLETSHMKQEGEPQGMIGDV